MIRATSGTGAHKAFRSDYRRAARTSTELKRGVVSQRRLEPFSSSNPRKQKRRKLREFAAIYLAVARPIVPRTPSLELYVLPIGGGQLINFRKSSGAEGDRTPDLCSAIAALSQLSYSPARTRQTVLEPGRADPSHRIKAKAPRNNAGPLFTETSGSAPKVKTPILSSGL